MSKHDLKVERVIQKPVADVFRALGEGRLFMTCGADAESLQIDFKVGGKYRINFKNYNLTNVGEFLEIIPNKKIVFTWCSSFDEPLTPDTEVTVELASDGNKTRLSLLHAGFKTAEDCEGHKEGWNAGLNDLSTEMEAGKLRLVRVFAAPVSKLFAECRERMVKGEVLESVADKRLSFAFDSTKVTLSFDVEDDGGSSVELVHDGLTTDAAQKTNRIAWQKLTEDMVKTLGRNA